MAIRRPDECRIIHASFKVSAFKRSQFPGDGLPQVAFAGRSNVGKSSLMNRLLVRRNLVKVSSRPGFTQSINFFDIRARGPGGEFMGYLVDLPGYGYAKAPKSLITKWKGLVGDYFSSELTIKGVVAIFDIRRDPDAMDLELISFLGAMEKKTLVVLNKCDKIGGSRLRQRASAIEEAIRIYARGDFLDTRGIHIVSARTGRGVDELRRAVLGLFLRDCPLF